MILVKVTEFKNMLRMLKVKCGDASGAASPPCTAHLHNRLVCRHDIDHVTKDEHIES